MCEQLFEERWFDDSSGHQRAWLKESEMQQVLADCTKVGRWVLNAALDAYPQHRDALD